MNFGRDTNKNALGGFVKPVYIMSFYVRLLEERKELDDKITGLKSFLQSDNLKTIDATQQSLLKTQLPVMVAYSEILQERIQLLNT